MYFISSNDFFNGFSLSLVNYNNPGVYEYKIIFHYFYLHVYIH